MSEKDSDAFNMVFADGTLFIMIQSVYVRFRCQHFDSMGNRLMGSLIGTVPYFQIIFPNASNKFDR